MSFLSRFFGSDAKEAKDAQEQTLRSYDGSQGLEKGLEAALDAKLLLRSEQGYVLQLPKGKTLGFILPIVNGYRLGPKVNGRQVVELEELYEALARARMVNLPVDPEVNPNFGKGNRWSYRD